MLSAISEHLGYQAQLSIIVYSSMKPKKLLESIASMANELDTAGLIVQADLFDDFLNKVTPHFDLTDKLKKEFQLFKKEVETKSIGDTISHLPRFIARELGRIEDGDKQSTLSRIRAAIAHRDVVAVPVRTTVKAIKPGVASVYRDPVEGLVVTVAAPLIRGVGNMFGTDDDYFVYSGFANISIKDGDSVAGGQTLGLSKQPSSKTNPSFVRISKMVDDARVQISSAEINLSVGKHAPVKPNVAFKFSPVGISSTDAFLPVDAPIKGDSENRSTKTYDAVIDQFDVDENPRYTPRAIGSSSRHKATFCNIFVWDVTSAMGSPLPHWVDDNGNPGGGPGKGFRELNANASVGWLADHGSRFGWKEVDEVEAQDCANKGLPVVAGQRNVSGSSTGHIAMVRPGTIRPGAGPAVANVGAKNINKSHVANTFGGSQYRNKSVRYWANLS